MYELIDNNENRFINEIMMMRPCEDRVILVVEGKDDEAILKHHIIPSQVKIVRSEGKTNALAAAKYASENNMLGIFFLVDLDYDDIVSFENRYPLVIFSKSHDLFMDLLIANIEVMCRLIEGVILSILNDDIELDSRECAVKIFRQAVDLSNRLVAVRISSYRNNLNLSLKDFPFGNLSSSNPYCREIAKNIKYKSGTDLDIEHIENLVGPSVLDGDSIPDFVEIKSILNGVGDHDFISAMHKVISCHFPSAKKLPRNYFRDYFLTMIPCGNLAEAAWISLLNNKLSEMKYEIFRCPNCVHELIDCF